MTQDDQTKLALASVSDTLKQILTLSTGILTLEITFFGFILGKSAEKGITGAAHTLLLASWIFFLISALFGVIALLALTGTLSKSTLTPTTVYNINIRGPALIQVACFILGLALTVLTAFFVKM